MTASINYQMKIMSYASSKSWLTGKDPVAGKDWKQKEKRAAEDERVDRITDSAVMNLSKLWETVEDRGPWRAAVHRVAKSQTQLSDWTELPEVPRGVKFIETKNKVAARRWERWS